MALWIRLAETNLALVAKQENVSKVTRRSRKKYVLSDPSPEDDTKDDSKRYIHGLIPRASVPRAP